MLLGSDFSAVQGPAPARAMQLAGHVFCFHRCKVGNNPGRDVWFERNVRVFQSVGILAAPYMFPFPLNHLAPEEQAGMFADAAMLDGHPLGSGPNEPPPGFDLEWPPPEDWAKHGLTADSICDWALACLAKMTLNWAGNRPVVYSYPYFLAALSKARRFAELTAYRLWIAGGNGYLTRKTPPADPERPPIVPGWGSDWLFWQWNGNGGALLPNGVDADFDSFNGDIEALRALCRSPGNDDAAAPTLDPAVIAAQAANVMVDDALHAYRQQRADAMLAAA